MESRRDKDVIGILEDIAEESLESTNFFHSGPEPTWYALNPEAECVGMGSWAGDLLTGLAQCSFV